MRKTLILIRHGESEGNVDKNAYILNPDHTVPLTEKGKSQADLAGRRLNKVCDYLGLDPSFFQKFVSPYTRTKQTCQIALKRLINKHKINTPIEEPLIREHEYIQDPQSVEQVAAEINRMDEKERFWHRFTGGESFADVDQRVATFTNMLKIDEVDHTILFTHGNYSEAFVRRVLNINQEEFRTFGNIDNCNIIVIKNMKYIDSELSTPSSFIDSLKRLGRVE